MRPIAWLAALGMACSGGTVESPAEDSTGKAPPVEVPKTPGMAVFSDVTIPEPGWNLAGEDLVSPASRPPDRTTEPARAVLLSVVETYARDPQNPWAVCHAWLALGPDVELTNGQNGVDFIFSEYAEEVQVGPDILIRFPQSRGDIRIEPHTDLVLKNLAEVGVGPNRTVTVGGKPHEIGDLYRYALARTWVDGEKVSGGEWNDTPWTLQGLATWAPPDLAWNADGGHAMTLDAFTSAEVAKLRQETDFLHTAMRLGTPIQKRKQGIFAYTCGGAHLIQGSSYAVARGFGSDDDAETMRGEIEALFARLAPELDQIADAMATNPTYTVLLLSQRLKFLGHFLETTHKAAALGTFSPSEAQKKEMLKALSELIATVLVIDKAGIFAKLPEIQKADFQQYLDFVGDAAHGLRGLDLATGVGTIRR